MLPPMTLNTERLFNPHSHAANLADNKENDQPASSTVPSHMMLASAPQAHAVSMLKRPYAASSPYKADGGRPMKRASLSLAGPVGMGNWMSPSGKRKSGSGVGSIEGFQGARKSYKVLGLGFRLQGACKSCKV